MEHSNYSRVVYSAPHVGCSRAFLRFVLIGVLAYLLVSSLVVFYTYMRLLTSAICSCYLFICGLLQFYAFPSNLNNVFNMAINQACRRLSRDMLLNLVAGVGVLYSQMCMKPFHSYIYIGGLSPWRSFSSTFARSTYCIVIH